MLHYFRILFLPLLLLLSSAQAAEDSIVLALNCENTTALPCNFRTAPSIRASASGQFSEKGFYSIQNSIPKGTLFVVDLREESHCFVNGHAIYWRNERNWANCGKNLEMIQQDQDTRQQQVLRYPTFSITNRSCRLKIEPQNAFSEKTLVESAGARYIRIPVTDHRIPTDDAVDRFIAFYNALTADSWVHYHCSAGRGRASTFIVMHDIMRNGNHSTLKEILSRQGNLGGKNFTQPIAKGNWKTPYEQERMVFIQQFYLYRQQTQGSIPWSQWTKNNS